MEKIRDIDAEEKHRERGILVNMSKRKVKGKLTEVIVIKHTIRV